MSDNNKISEFPFDFLDTSELSHQFKYVNADKYKKFNSGDCLVGPKRYCIDGKYKSVAKQLYNFKVRPDDVWIVGYPRSGTTISEELVWLLCNDLDYETASKFLIGERVPYFDLCYDENAELMQRLIEIETAKAKGLDVEKIVVKPNYEKLVERTGKRIIKTHLPFSLLPPGLLTSGCKVIYLARFSMDVCISMYHIVNLLRKDFPYTIEEYVEIFMKGLAFCTPHLEHVKEGWQNRNRENCMFVFYEELNKNLRDTIERYASFLRPAGAPLSGPEMDKLVAHLHIDSFRNNRTVNNEYLREAGVTNPNADKFIRRGDVGGWRGCLSEEMVREVEEWLQKEMQNCDIKFPNI